MKRPTIVIITLLALPACLALAERKLVGEEFDSETWPGQVPSDRMEVLAPHARALEEALRAENEAEILLAVEAIKKGLGEFVGVPESLPEYASPIDDSLPNIDRVVSLWQESFERMKGRHGWETASPRTAKYQEGNRLRVSVRHVRAYLQSYDANVDDPEEFLAYAKDGCDYIVGAQSSKIGVFGYPYHPEGPGLKQFAATVVQGAIDAGHPIEEMVENGWVINVFNRGDGGLQFDNGMCGLALLYGYSVTKDERYLEAARKAGDWAAEQILVRNWNYNCFSGHLLARLYRVTGERRYLDAANTKFKLGVLPGLMDNGRWADPHNAKIQYHSVMVRALIEYYLALQQADDAFASELRPKIELTLDNLSEQITTYGASNFGELLSLDAICLGLMTFGPHQNWERAANVNVNCLMDYALPRLEVRGMPMTETVANYLLYRATIDADVSAREVMPRLGLSGK